MIPVALIPILGELITLVPNITKWITGSDAAEEVAERVIGIARKVTGTDSDTAAIAALKADPNLVLKYEEALLTQQLEMARLSAGVIKDVNVTMQKETESAHWPSYSWRPYIGFSFGTYVNSLWLLPLFKVAPVIMSPDLVMAVGGILGVASWFRGKMQADPQVISSNKG